MSATRRRTTNNSVRTAIAAAATPSVPPLAAVAPVPAHTPATTNLMLSPNTFLSTKSMRTIEDLVNERLADKLPKFVAKEAPEFLAWALAVKAHFSRLPGFREDILIRPRLDLSFDTISDTEVEFIYQYIWDRLYPVVSMIPGIHSKLTRVQRYNICGLWKIVNEKFLPMNEEDRQDRATNFCNMTQGSSTIREFTDRVLGERDILLYLGFTKDDADVRRTICKGLANREAKQFALLSGHLMFDDFVEKINRYDHIFEPETSKLHTALLAETTSTRRIPLAQRQCWHCLDYGHIRAYCPLQHLPQDSLSGPRKRKSSTPTSGRSDQTRSYSSDRGKVGRSDRSKENSTYYQPQANAVVDSDSTSREEKALSVTTEFSTAYINPRSANF